MEVSSLKKNQPYLDSVFGSLSAEDDSKIREILGEVDRILLEIAEHFGRDQAGWEDTGLELKWMQSGQVSIGSCVGVCSAKGECVDFCLEFRPSWYFGERSSVLSWDVESRVEADCGHSVDHSYMHTVHEVSTKIENVIEAAIAMRDASIELKRIALEFPLEHWLDLSSDIS